MADVVRITCTLPTMAESIGLVQFSASTSSSCVARFPSQVPIPGYPLRIRATGAGKRSAFSKSSRRNATSDGSYAVKEPSSVSPLELLKTSAGNRYTKERSSILVVGLEFHSAPVEVREKLSIPEEQWPQAMSELCDLFHIEEAALLSTCNRTEIYAVALSRHRGVKEVTGWMAKITGIPLPQLSQYLYLLYNKDATRHLFEVASGLDPGVQEEEGQVLYRVMQVVESGREVPGFDKKLTSLFNHAIAVGEFLVSSTAVELALMRIPESHYTALRVLVVGAGKMGKLVIRHLAAKGCKKIVVVDKLEDKVKTMREEELQDIEVVSQPFSELLVCAANADVLFIDTVSEAPLFLKQHVQMLPHVSTHIGGQRLFVDLSVSGSVGKCVSDLETAFVYRVDNLNRAVNRKRVQAILTEAVKNFEAWKDSLQTVPTVKRLCSLAEWIRASLLNGNAKFGEDLSPKEKEAFDRMSKDIVDKFLDGPLQHLRSNGTNSQSLCEILENVRVLNRIFELDTDHSELEKKIRAKMERTQKK